MKVTERSISGLGGWSDRPGGRGALLNSSLSRHQKGGGKVPDAANSFGNSRSHRLSAKS
jgi:hypothetical protein